MAIKMIQGHIPDMVAYFCRDKMKLESFWEDNSLQSGFCGQEVLPTYCCDASKEKTKETGHNWASQTHSYGTKSVNAQEFVKNNDPLTNVKIVSLEIRSEGGRAYKTLIDDLYYVDIREDVLMDTMIECGISKGGILNGEFVWAVIGSQFKLVRVGSLLHKSLVENTAIGKSKKIKDHELIIGHCYRGKSADIFVYLGKVNAIELNQETDRTTYSAKYINKTRKNHNDVFLFVKIGIADFTNKKLEDIGWYRTELKKTHSFLQDLGEIKYPLDVIGTIKSEVVKSVARNNSQYKNNPTDYVYYCKWLSMEMFPNPATVPSELTSTINEFVLTK